MPRIGPIELALSWHPAASPPLSFSRHVGLSLSIPNKDYHVATEAVCIDGVRCCVSLPGDHLSMETLRWLYEVSSLMRRQIDGGKSHSSPFSTNYSRLSTLLMDRICGSSRRPDPYTSLFHLEDLANATGLLADTDLSVEPDILLDDASSCGEASSLVVSSSAAR